MKPSSLRVPLIVDSDENFIKTLSSDQAAEKIPPLFAKSGKEAQLILADPTRLLSAVFVNTELSNPSGISVIRFAHQFHPALPIFVLFDKEIPYTEKELRMLGVEKSIEKTVTYTDIIHLINPLISAFEMNNALEISKNNQDAIGAEVSEEDANFISIRAENFIAGSRSSFDVYVRLSSGRYVKLLQAGDNFSPDRVNSYLKKGVTRFYMRKEVQEHYLAFCDTLASNLVKAQSVSNEIKIAQTLNQGEETIQFFKRNGINEANIQYAANFVKNVTELVKQLNPSKQPILAQFMNDAISYDHGTGTAMIASMLIHPMKITSMDPVETVGLASFFHDIGLKQMSEKFLDEDESQMTEEEKKIYYNHPIESAAILSQLSNIKPAVIQAVAQHHERRNRNGFPHHLGSGSISVVSEIVGISNEFFRAIERVKKNPKLDIKKEVKLQIVDSFSQNIVREFNKIFNFSD